MTKPIEPPMIALTPKHFVVAREGNRIEDYRPDVAEAAQMHERELQLEVYRRLAGAGTDPDDASMRDLFRVAREILLERYDAEIDKRSVQ